MTEVRRHGAWQWGRRRGIHGVVEVPAHYLGLWIPMAVHVSHGRCLTVRWRSERHGRHERMV